jgi:hypothetical protein
MLESAPCERTPKTNMESRSAAPSQSQEITGAGSAMEARIGDVLHRCAGVGRTRLVDFRQSRASLAALDSAEDLGRQVLAMAAQDSAWTAA